MEETSYFGINCSNTTLHEQREDASLLGFETTELLIVIELNLMAKPGMRSCNLENVMYSNPQPPSPLQFELSMGEGIFSPKPSRPPACLTPPPSNQCKRLAIDVLRLAGGGCTLYILEA